MQSRYMQNRLRDLCLRPSDASSPCNDDDVQPGVETCTVLSQALPDQTSHPVTDHAVADLLACDNSYSVLLSSVFRDIHHEITVLSGDVRVVHRLKLPAFS